MIPAILALMSIRLAHMWQHAPDGSVKHIPRFWNVHPICIKLEPMPAVYLLLHQYEQHCQKVFSSLDLGIRGRMGVPKPDNRAFPFHGFQTSLPCALSNRVIYHVEASSIGNLVHRFGLVLPPGLR